MLTELLKGARIVRVSRTTLAIAAFVLVVVRSGHGAAYTDVQRRIDGDIAQGKPVVVHVVVALCDNVHQGIVPVSPSLGNGRDPRNNLYWGALYGFRTHLVRSAEYEVVSAAEDPMSGVLQKVVLHKVVDRGGQPCDVLVVGEAWDGREMESAVNRFLSLAAGRRPENSTVSVADRVIEYSAGGASPLVVFIGHNGLMDFDLGSAPAQNTGALPRSSVVLACASKPYFSAPLARGGSNPLILTTGLMAPEAYTLEAIIDAFVRGRSPLEIRDAAAAAYHEYQKCGPAAAKRLFAAGD